MKKPEWEKARELFLDLADLPEDQSSCELEKVAAEDPELASWVRALLQHDSDPEERQIEPRPRRFGPYEVVRPIGRGGMGDVFVARRADGEYERDVAVKLLRGGIANDHLLRRFQRERQTLARLDHEYIARLIDGGTTNRGEPYLVMELVEGEPADVFAAKLELRERVELFVRICQAVDHAHERGFVHRDLKPSNILVRSDGTPRLLDFGIARPDDWTEQPDTPEHEPLTRTGHRLFTPEYASPEQIRGETVTVRSDIFALGVLFYEFLCGCRPWKPQPNFLDLERTICEEEPAPPSRLVTGTARTRVAGDLDAVALQCLAKRPQERYESVAELGADLERHLTGRPIQARRTGVLGRVVRLARRRPAYPIGAALLALTVLAVGFAWITDRRGERSRAELTAAVTDRLAAANVLWSDGELERAEEELADALVALRELPREKALQAAVLAQQAVFANLQRNWAEGLEIVERARALVDRFEESDYALVQKILNTRAYALQNIELGGERSRTASRAALDHARLHLFPGDVLRVDAILGWSVELRAMGRDDEALGVLGEAVRESRERDPRAEEFSRLLNEQAVAQAELGRYAEAAESYREALEILGWHRGEGHAAFAKVRFNLGRSLHRLGELDEAQREYERSLIASRENELGLLTASNLHFLARIHSDRGDLDEAAEAVLEALELRQQLIPGIPVDRSRCLLGIVLARTERWEQARELLEPLLATARPGQLAPEMEAQARHLLGVHLDDAGDDVAARPHLARALELKREQLGDGHADCVDLARRLAGES